MPNNQIFLHTPDVNSKIRSVMLKVNEWKILFAIDGKKNVSQLSASLNFDEKIVETTIKNLVTKNLVTEKSAIPEPRQKTASAVAEAAPAMTAAKPAASPMAGSTGKKKILVVDDSLVIRKMVEIALENEEVQIIMAANGESALKLADQESPDMMLLDMVLPDIQGMDVLKTIREKYKFPILMLTGKDSPVDGESATKEGATDYLNKPFQDADLLAKFKQYI